MATTYFRVDTREFSRAISLLAAAKKKDLANVVNKKLYYVARKSVWYTQVANYERIANELGQNYTRATGKRSNSFKMVKHSTFNNARTASAPLAAILVNFFRGKLGKSGLRGAAMVKEVQRFVGKRLRSIGFLKAGWIAARDVFKSKAKILTAPEGTIAGKSKRTGVARLGGGIPAVPADRIYAAIWNQANYLAEKNPETGQPYNHEKALIKYGLPALNKAFTEELADTKTELEKELRKSARGVGVKTN